MLWPPKVTQIGGDDTFRVNRGQEGSQRLSLEKQSRCYRSRDKPRTKSGASQRSGAKVAPQVPGVVSGRQEKDVVRNSQG